MADRMGFTICDDNVAVTVNADGAVYDFPQPFTLVGLASGLTVPQVGGPLLQVSAFKNGVAFLAAPLAVPNGQRLIVGAAAAVFDVGDRVSIGPTQIGDGTAKGLKVTMLGYQPFGALPAATPPVDPPPTPPPATVYATWSPTDKAAAVTLSNGNKTAGLSAGGAGVRCTLGGPTKWQVEVHFDALSFAGGAQALCGVANAAASLTAGGCGANVNGWGYEAANGKCYHANAESPGGPPLAVGDFLTILRDGDKVYFRPNGVPILGGAPAFSGLAGDLFVMFSANGANGTQQATINAGATPFVAPVAGYPGLGA